MTPLEQNFITWLLDIWQIFKIVFLSIWQAISLSDIKYFFALFILWLFIVFMTDYTKGKK